ncbi:glycoside hydrolase [Brevibacillus fluminis]|uniref:glycoside hydrolase n=1 Tax=Brevibacillus fluminis TaxID=511487 RepID=UPI003F8A23DB
MNQKKTFLPLLLAASLVAGCSEPVTGTVTKQPSASASDAAPREQAAFTFDVQPETFDLQIETGGARERVSQPLPKQVVADFHKTATSASWTYPEQKVKVEIAKQAGGLHVQMTSTGAASFTWPIVQGDSYILPLGEGKYIPARDANWLTFLQDQRMTFSESFSMRFFAAAKPTMTILYIADDIFNDEVAFQAKEAIGFSFTHEFSRINPKKTYGFTLYPTENDPTKIAKLYKADVVRRGEFVTLKEKAKTNPNMEKLYGAPHIYLWDKTFISDTNIRWPKLAKKLGGPFGDWLVQLALQETEDGKEAADVIKAVKKQDYVDQYQRRIIVRLLNDVLQLQTFYKADVFPNLDAATKALMQKGAALRSESELYQANKQVLKSALQDAADDVSLWGADKTVKLLQEMRDAGIARAWIGLPDWTEGFINPGLVKQANEQGYLIGPYDSYHSIHETENKEWQTAYFPEKGLYDSATITNQNGKKIGGFLQQGRKLNPTLSLPSVQNRVTSILASGDAYNSWFVDCDATGELYDDYTPGHETTQEQDMKARLQRMAYIANDKHLVIGSEGGNDYASGTIAFAHGLETPVIAWGDPDMRENRQSPYYTGAYWSPDGGVPARFGKQVPIKTLYEHVYLDPAYNVPLFKLVYNDAVITTHHWEWGSFKIKGQTEQRMLAELLYDVPPLYHLDKATWDRDKDRIVRQLKVFSPFHEKAVTREMTGFHVLSKDRLVQMTEFGNDLRVIANFSSHDFTYNRKVIKANAALLADGTSEMTYRGHGE